MTNENRRRNIASELAKGGQALAAARTLVSTGLGNDAVSRGYYAAYHFASALLLTKDVEARRHGAIPRLLKRHLQAELAAEAISEFARIQTFRNSADYDRETNFEVAEAEDEIRSVESFIATARGILERGGWLDPE